MSSFVCRCSAHLLSPFFFVFLVAFSFFFLRYFCCARCGQPPLFFSTPVLFYSEKCLQRRNGSLWVSLMCFFRVYDSVWGYLPSFLFLFVVFCTFIAAVFICFFGGEKKKKKDKETAFCYFAVVVVVVCAIFLCLFRLIFFFFFLCMSVCFVARPWLWAFDHLVRTRMEWRLLWPLFFFFFCVCVWCLLAWGIVRCYLWAYCVKTDKCDCPHYYSFCFVVVVFGGKSRERLALDSIAKQEKETCSVCCSS